MPKYVIEREMPGAGKLSQADLRAAAQKSYFSVQLQGATV